MELPEQQLCTSMAKINSFGSEVTDFDNSIFGVMVGTATLIDKILEQGVTRELQESSKPQQMEAVSSTYKQKLLENIPQRRLNNKVKPVTRKRVE